MPLYSKNREISDKELDQVLGGTSAFGGSMLKYQIGRRVFSNANDARVQNLVLKLRKATR